MKRIFIGIKTSSKLNEQTAKWIYKHKELPVRWTSSDNLHITLLPPWEADNREIERVKEVLGNIDYPGPFEVRFDRVSLGPNRREPRLIWAEGQAPAVLLELIDSLKKELGFDQRTRDFKLHLTLARFKKEDFTAVPFSIFPEKVDFSGIANGFDLIESILLPSGANYSQLYSIRLG